MSRYELKRFDLLCDLGEAELDLIEDMLEPIHLAKGDQLFREGQESEGLLLVHEGSLEIESQRAGRLGAMGPGSTLGRLALVVVGPREVTAVAAEPSCVLLLSRTAFHRLVEDSPRSGARMLEALVRELATALRSGLDRLA